MPALFIFLFLIFSFCLFSPTFKFTLLYIFRLYLLENFSDGEQAVCSYEEHTMFFPCLLAKAYLADKKQNWRQTN